MTDGLKAAYRAAIIDILAANERVERAVLFGSRAMETFTPASDVDIALFGDHLTLTDQASLAIAIDELPMAQRVDLLLHKTVDNDALREHIEQHGVEWYRRRAREKMAGSPWKRLPLGDFVTLQRGHDLPDAIRRPGNKPVLGSFGVTGWHDEARAAGPGVTVGRSGASFGVVSYSPVDYWPLNTALYVVDFHGNDQRFAYYFLKQFDFRTYNSGSAQPSLNRNFIHPIPVNVPPLPEQRAIAHILGSLDDKIELNRRMNETLEEMARALFKSWFIDFDPVHAKAALKRPSPPLITPPLRGSRQAKGDSPQARRWGVVRRSYTQHAQQKARSLRENQTDAEGLLWHYLRHKQLDGHKFRRQQPIGPYIVDFACMPRKVIVELDGGQHAERRSHDERRDRFLQGQGYRLLRFWNNEVFENCFGVLERIYEAVQNPPPPQPAPSGLASATPPQGGSDRTGKKAWTVERARAYLDRMDPSIAALFPDRFVDSELGEVPEGWEVKALGEVVELAYGKALKAAARKGGAIPVYGSNGQVGWHDKKLATGPGIIVGRKGNPGVTTWVQSDFFPIDTTFYVVPKEDKQSLHFLFYALERQGLANLTADSAVPGLNRNLAYMNKLLIPDGMAIASFNDYAKTLFARRHQLEEETRALTALRDTLLPKLVSGEVRIPEAEKLETPL